MDGEPGEVVVALDGVVLRRGGTRVLDGLDWTVRAGQRWVVLGPNGAGKTTALRFAGARELPVGGTVDVLGARIGRVDLRELRRRIGYLTPDLATDLPPGTTAREAVVTGHDAVLRAWRRSYTPGQHAAAGRLLAEFGCADLADRTLATLSEGERQRVLLARALVAGPELLLLDEPSARLDLLGRERVVAALGTVAARMDAGAAPRAVVVVTHHLEEVPPGFTHVLLVGGGRAVAAGPAEEVLTGPRLSAAFGAELVVTRHGGRWSARLAG